MVTKSHGKITGACLCGAVSVTLAEPKPVVEICHCTMCRQWGGGPFMGVSGCSHTINGHDFVTVYQSSSWAERAFCSICGSNLYFRFVPSDHYSFCAGLFPFDAGVQMGKQIFIDEKPDFYDFSQETDKQTGAQVIAEAIAAGFTFTKSENES